MFVPIVTNYVNYLYDLVEIATLTRRNGKTVITILEAAVIDEMLKEYKDEENKQKAEKEKLQKQAKK